MTRALELAELGRGLVQPNPLVGAVIVKNKKIIGEGWHRAYGESHAEINAINTATENVEGATLYVNLEPCCHFGKTPPCVDAIIKNKFKTVVIGMEDPNEKVSGKGIEKLRAKRIEVRTGVLEKKAKKMNEVFIKFITTQMPFCTLKTAMTLDGKIATHTGDSKWISNEKSRTYVHQLRAYHAAILTGIGTVINDNPQLTVRMYEQEGIKQPIRIVVDSTGRIPLNANVLKFDDAKTIIAVSELADAYKINAIKEKGVEVVVTPVKNNKVDLPYLLKLLGKKGIDSLLIEGGSHLNFSLFEEGLIDKVLTFIAPKIVGGDDAKTPVGGIGFSLIKDSIQLMNIHTVPYGDDLMIEAYVSKGG